VCEIVGGGPIPARMRSALVERQLECVIAGCHADRHLEIDHNQPIEAGGSTALWNLNRLCPHHHRHKHEHDLRLVGTGSDQRFVPAAEWSAPGDHPP
jgi:5-methylcytosine-specific restriction endonuclease McrA